MISILFVDDEPNILTGLQRMLRPLRHEWEMAFANSGVEALDVLAQRKVDVIVSDMKMPGMDGAQLLQQVSNKYPHLVRIILSGYAEKDLILRAISVAHQYLAKPCDAEILKATVSRACALRDLLANETLRQLVSQLTVVPSLPILYQQLLEELKTPEPSIKKVSDIIQQDMGMTVKILQIINSAFFGLQRNICSTREAVSFLGIDTVTALTLGVGIFSQLHGEQSQPLIDQLWDHSIKVAELAQSLAASETPGCAADAFTAGLLHDIGQVILAINLPQEYQASLALMKSEGLTCEEVETRIFGASNAAIGAYLLGLWGVPYPVVEAVAYHHNPYSYPSNSFTALTAVHVANVLIDHAECDVLASPEIYLDSEYLKRMRMWEKIPAWHAAGMKKDAQAA